MWNEIKADSALIHNGFSYKNLIKDIIILPEFQLLISYRIQKALYKYRVGKPFFKVLQLLTRWYVGCIIGVTAEIEGGIIITHSVGIVIGERTLIKSGALIFQNVTIAEGVTIGRNTIVYSGAVVLQDVGDNCTVGANSVVTRIIPNGKIAMGIPARY